MELVSVIHAFQYTSKDGRLVSIQPKETYILLCKTNEHWWRVRKDLQTRPIYVPAQYVRELGEHYQAGDTSSSSSTQGFPVNITDLNHSCQTTTQHTQAGDYEEMHSSPAPNHKHMETSAEASVKQTLESSEDQGFPPPPTPVCDVPHLDFHPSESSASLSPPDEAENENLHSAVYVNVGQLRQSVSTSPPTAPSSYSPPYFSPEGWQVHVDQESGQEYYYHPTTGRSTWENPFRDSPSDLEARFFPSPPQSPTSSPLLAWTSAWEQLVDENTGRPYFHNTMSGETSWEPPEPPSPYSLLETTGVPRIQDGPPPLPEEDYPSGNYPTVDPPPPELYEELLATGPPTPTLPKDLSFSSMGRTMIPRAALDRTTPTGWNLNVEPNGTWVFSTENSPDQWIKSVDDRGQTFYYLRNGSRSQWTLPEVPLFPNLPNVENGVELENPSVIKNWRHSMGPLQLNSSLEDGRFVPTHRRKTSDYSSDSSSTGNSPETQHNVQNLEKAGILNKTKISENGKKVRKNWTQNWSVLHGGVLTFHKDPKPATTGSLSKTNQIVPEVAVDLRGATIGWATKDKSSKKNVLELKGKNGVEFLIQYDTESIISDWHKALSDTIRQLDYQDHHSEDEDTEYEKMGSLDRDEKPAATMDRRRANRNSSTSSASTTTTTAPDNDPKKVRTKLMKFLMKRPTLQSVKEKGYIRDNVFGCHLATLCAFEKTTVPSFVEKCIKAVERRGLDIDGLYRVSGNLAVIQKLRFKADHEELDLEDGQWEDVHVLTGALKLFFRELPEPLFPYSHFHEFIHAVRFTDYNVKRSRFYELVHGLPPPNHDTMKLLFEHLHRVIEYGEDNRMTVQNVAIVFGPTLLRPENESSNIAMHMVFQNQIVEFILNEYEHIFK